MTIMVDDLGGVEAWSGSVGIPVGDFLTEIADVEEGKPGGTPHIVVEWRVVDGPEAGATSREWVYVTQRSLGKVKAFLEAVGYPIPPGQFQMPTTQLKGRRARTVWREQPHEGKTQIKCVAHSAPTVAVGGGGDVPIITAGLPPVGDDLPF